jgi:hypothetical protein
VSRLGTHLEVTAVLQQLVGTQHRGEADPLLSAVPADRGEAVAAAEGAGVDETHQLIREALVEDPLAAPGRP